MLSLNPVLFKKVWNLEYPINRVVEFQDNLDHSTYLGFTWVLTHLDRFPKGRTTTTNAGTQGGEKTHTLIQSELPSEVVVSANVGSSVISGVSKGSATSWVLSGLRDVGTANSQSHNNEPQFEITAYWKRTA